MTEDPMDVAKMIADMNRSIPLARRTLLDYEGSDDLTYRTKDGSVCSMERGEIEFLSSVCTEIEKMRLRLPLFISTDVSYSGGAWKVDGSVESAVVARILGRTQFREDSVRFYHPDLKILRKKLPNAAVMIFVP